MHDRVIATEITGMKFDISIYMAVEHVLAQKSKENGSRTAQVTIINEHVNVNAVGPDSFSGSML